MSDKNRCGVHRAVKVYYCEKCDTGYSKEQFINHLVRHLPHKKTLSVFDSQTEFAYFRELQIRKKAKNIDHFWVHPQFNVYYIPAQKTLWGEWKSRIKKKLKGYKLLFYYKPDFVIFNNIPIDKPGAWILEWIDVKGRAKKVSKKTGKLWTSRTTTFNLKIKILRAMGIEVQIK